MSARTAFAAVVAMTFAWSAPASAQDEGPLELPDCGRPVPVSRTMLRGASFTGGALRPGGGAYLVANLPSPARATLLFLRDRSGRWHGHAILPVSSILRVFQSSRSGDVFAWAWNDAEGPGSSFTGIHAAGAGGGIFCVELPFPDALNQPSYSGEFLAFEGFNIAPTGRGIVIGEAEVERDGRTRHWIYRYSSTDFGRTWSRPARVPSRPPTPGAYRAVTGAAPAALVRSLLAQAR
jgi:hypothetical protein